MVDAGHRRVAGQGRGIAAAQRDAAAVVHCRFVVGQRLLGDGHSLAGLQMPDDNAALVRDREAVRGQRCAAIGLHIGGILGDRRAVNGRRKRKAAARVAHAARDMLGHGDVQERRVGVGDDSLPHAAGRHLHRLRRRGGGGRAVPAG